MRASDLTIPQRGALVRIARHAREGKPVTAKTPGIGQRMVEKLAAKGLIAVTRVEFGPRGGRTQFFEPTEQGRRFADRIIFNLRYF